MSKHNPDIVKLPKRYKIMAAVSAARGYRPFKQTIKIFAGMQKTADEYKKSGYKGAWWRKGEKDG